MASEDFAHLTIDLQLLPALEAWAAHASLRGKSMQDVFRKAMRFAIDFAIAKTPKGDRAKIKADLSALTTEYQISEATGSGPRARVKSASAKKWRGTLAAALTYRLNYKGAQALARARDPGFYALVGKFAAGRQYATNLHAAGFKPAQQALRGPSPGVRLPAFHHPPGTITQQFDSDTAARILVENFASSAQIPGQKPPIGIAGLLGDKINLILPELNTLFTRFLEDDLILSATNIGFKELKSLRNAA